MLRRLPVTGFAFAAAACAAPFEPAPPARGPAPEAAPFASNFFADVAVGAGEYEHDTEGGLDGDTDGTYVRVRGEFVADAAIGGGFAIEGAASDDDLFEDLGSPDAEGGFGDLFLYFTGVPQADGVFRMPIRVGPYFHTTTIEEDSTSSDIDWDGIGVRFELEPEVWIVRRAGFSFGFAGDASFGAHVTSIDAEISGVSDDFDGDGWALGAGLGVQALFGDHVSTRLGYVYRRTHEDESDASGGVVVREADASFSGFAFQLGVRF
jgi:hypothetical protein